MTDTPEAYTQLILPPNVVSKVDVSRLVSEVERIDNELTEASIRTDAGQATVMQPRISEQFAQLLEVNKLAFTTSTERSELIRQVRILKDKAPTIHMTFAVEADRESLQSIAQWLRSSVHPQAVIAVGLQPALVAGVYLRTPNHVHDLSLRARLDAGRDLLVKELEVCRGRS